VRLPSGASIKLRLWDDALNGLVSGSLGNLCGFVRLIRRQNPKKRTC
jgi:hypothetical protein